MAQTVIITETSAYVVLTFSGGKVKYAPKSALAIQYDPNARDEDKVILSWASGVNQSKYDFERLNYLKVTSPTLASDTALVALLTAMADNAVGASSGGAGGGSIVYTNAANDFVATPTTSAKTITITSLPFVLESKHVVGGTIVKVDSAGNPATIFNGSQQFTVSGGVITLPDADDFVSGDTVVVTLIADDKAYAKIQDALKVLIQNSEWSHYTDEEHSLTKTNDAVANYYYSPEIFMAGFRDITAQFKGTTSGTSTDFKIFATLNPDAATPTPASAPSNDWEEVSVAFLGASPLPLNGVSVIKTNNREMVHKYIISYDIDNATNATDIFIRKY